MSELNSTITPPLRNTLESILISLGHLIVFEDITHLDVLLLKVNNDKLIVKEINEGFVEFELQRNVENCVPPEYLKRDVYINLLSESSQTIRVIPERITLCEQTPPKVIHRPTPLETKLLDGKDVVVRHPQNYFGVRLYKKDLVKRVKYEIA